MKKTTYILLAMAVLLGMFVSACGGAQTAPTMVYPVASQVPPTMPPTVEQPTQETSLIVSPTTQAFAPNCPADASSCSAPVVADTVAEETTCVNKVPYQYIFVPVGTKFESLNPNELICADNGTVVQGKHVIECRGKELWTTQLKLTASCAGGTNLETGNGQCADGFGYDAAQVCCAPLTGNDGGSITINVNIGACPGPRP